jgi:hypothetical protein
MNISRLVAGGMTLVVVGGCSDGRNIAGPTEPLSLQNSPQPAASAAAARRIQASGEFDAFVDFSTLTLTPRGRNCVLQVNGQLVFTGTIEGTATGQTTALVFASCVDVASNPPGTFADRFKSELVFEGTVDGKPATANVLYMGRVQPGGAIEGRLVFSKGVSGRLNADAVVAVGGEYEGSVVLRP